MVNADLERERLCSSINMEAVCNLLDGGADKTRRRRALRERVESEPLFCNSDNIHLTRVERFGRALRKARRLEELRRALAMEAGGAVEPLDERYLLEAIADTTPTYLHRLMFVPNLELLCDDEQRRYWLPLCDRMKVIGCYAQTELGHGTNIPELETVARYVPETDEFEIHSPSVTASKWWPGSLGRTANHAVLLAQLEIAGKRYGLHNFIVPLRSMETHRPLPGVTVGDIGPKIGFNSMDNGFLSLDRVRVPRRNMAARFARVERGGRYTAGGAVLDRMIPRLSMVAVRAFIIGMAGHHLARACTVAVRYSAVRRQGSGGGGGAESQVLDYTSQMHRLLPLVASAYAFHFTGVDMEARRIAMEALVLGAGAGIGRGDGGSGSGGGGQGSGVAVKAAEAVLQQYHADSSGLKSFCSGVAADGIEDCRRSCGGHGFLLCSGLPELLGTYLQNVTVEGENSVIIQQTARFLVKVVAAARAGAARPAAWAQSAYLFDFVSARKNPSRGPIAVQRWAANCAADARREELLEAALTHRAARLTVALEERLRTDAAAAAAAAGSGSATAAAAAATAWNDALVEVARVGRAHSMLLAYKAFAAAADAACRSGGSVTSGGCGGGNTTSGGRGSTAGGVGSGPPAALDAGTAAALRRLVALFALWWVERDMGDFCEDGFLDARQAGWVRRQVVELLREVRSDAVALVDAWDFSDGQLQSALGRRDGEVYAALKAEAARNPLNAQETVARFEKEVMALVRAEPVPRL